MGTFSLFLTIISLQISLDPVLFRKYLVVAEIMPTHVTSLG